MNIKKNKIIFTSIIIIFLVCVSLYVYLVVNSTSTLHFKVISEEDDGRTFEVPASSQGFGNEADGWANLEVNPTYSSGVRFINITIPKGSKIIDAHVKLYSIGLPNRNDHVNCKIYGDDVDNADDFYTTGCLDRCGRIYTNNYVLWDEKTLYDQWVTTPNLKEIIQEIIDRPGWEKGNTVVLLFITQNTQDTAVFNNYALGNSAELYIKFS